MSFVRKNFLLKDLSLRKHTLYMNGLLLHCYFKYISGDHWWISESWHWWKCWCRVLANVGVGCWWKIQGIFRVLQIFFMVSCLNLWKFIVFDSVPFGYGLCGIESMWTLSEWHIVHN
jgi:hypothetical protein